WFSFGIGFYKNLLDGFRILVLIELINQLLTQNYRQNASRTIAELTDFLDMDFTENERLSSEDYEKETRRTSTSPFGFS
ncbi:MAG TPA: hypothetical protein VI385_03930, partial [Flavisolibacter sp.]